MHLVFFTKCLLMVKLHDHFPRGMVVKSRFSITKPCNEVLSICWEQPSFNS
jgi:hypothetical protein